MEHIVRRQLVDVEQIHLGFELGQLRLQLLHAFFGGGRKSLETITGNLLFQIQLFDLVHFLLHLGISRLRVSSKADYLFKFRSVPSKWPAIRSGWPKNALSSWRAIS